MGSFGGFYKGEKRKPKKDQQKGVSSPPSSPVFTLPEIVGKKKKWE